MYTQCPDCLTIYQVGPQALAQARGNVACTHCTAIFDALRTLTEKLPADSDRLACLPSDEGLPRLDAPVMRPPVAAPQAWSQTTRGTSTPEFARGHRAASRSSRGIWKSGIALLGGLLIAQIAWGERNALLQNPVSRAWLDRTCILVHCTLPLAHDVDQLTLLSRDVRPHPSVANALIISAMLRNDADVAQSFPTVEITLADLDGQRIAMRRFKPEEYLGVQPLQNSGLAAHATTALVFEVADPGKNAVAFEFRFL